MKITSCNYNPQKDEKAVCQYGFLNLQEAFKNGVVPGNIDFDESDSNGIDDARRVGASVRDPFQARRAYDAMISAKQTTAPSAGSEAKPSET